MLPSILCCSLPPPVPHTFKLYVLNHKKIKLDIEIYGQTPETESVWKYIWNNTKGLRFPHKLVVFYSWGSLSDIS